MMGSCFLKSWILVYLFGFDKEASGAGEMALSAARNGYEKRTDTLANLTCGSPHSAP
jgi:hypothetical protein